MTCKRFQKRMILFFYEELGETEKQKLMRHIKSCSSCERQFRAYSRLFQRLGQVKVTETAGRWEDYWMEIQGKVGNERKQERYAPPVFKWGFAVAGFAFFLVLGILVGRLLLVHSGSRFEGKGADDRYPIKAAFVQYLDDLKPLMLDLSNASGSLDHPGEKPVEKEMIRSMLIQTRLLRSRLSLRNDPYINALLDDIEMILMEIDNTVPGDRVLMKSVRDMIHRKEIPIKIDLFQQRTGTI